MHSSLRLSLVAGIACGLSATTLAQTVFNEVEPNDSKAEANAFTLQPLDSIAGIVTGTASTTTDYFRITTAPVPAGVYRHRMVITTTGAAAHVGTIRGLNQSAGVIGATDTAVQTSSSSTTPARMVQWYGFGRAEDLYFRVTGTTSTTGDYTAAYEREPVTVEDLGEFPAGQLTLTTVGLNAGANSDLWVYNANFEPIEGFGNDDTLRPSTNSGSHLVREYGAGTYYVAITNSNLANHLPSPEDDDNRNGSVLDFAGPVANSSTTTSVNLTFRLSGGGAVQNVAATKTAPYEILFYRFTVAGTIPAGACCLLDNQATCVENTEYQCTTAGGVWKGAASTCATATCEKFVALYPPIPNTTSTNPSAFIDLSGSTSTLINRIDYFPTAGVGVAVHVDVYTRDGSYRGVETDPSAWTLHAAIDSVSAGGGSSSSTSFPTELALPTPILVQAGKTKAVKFHATVGNMAYRSESSPLTFTNGELAATSDRVTIGTAGTTISTPRGFGGAFFYVPADTLISGACCLLDGSCQSMTLAGCTAQNGLFRGQGSECASVTCQTAGACCLSDGSCVFVYQADCTVRGGTWSEPNQPCAAVSCSQPGACCFAEGAGCQPMQAAACATAGGVFQGPGTTCVQGHCWSEPVLWHNGPIATGPINTASVPAPNGGLWSEIQQGNRSIFGVFCYPSTSLGDTHIADDFVITAPGGWQINDVTLFGGRYNNAGTNFNQVYLQIWDGPPGAPGSSIVFGDLTTNRFIDSAALNTYRSNYNAASPATNGHIYAVRALVGATLAPGQYWIHYMLSHPDSFGISLTPPVTIVGSRGPAVGNARHFEEGYWDAIVEHVTSPIVGQEIPFIVSGAVLGPPPCYANCDNSTQEPVLNVQDFTCFLQRYAAGESYANCDNSTQEPVLNVQDFTCFLQRYAAGCP